MKSARNCTDFEIFLLKMSVFYYAISIILPLIIIYVVYIQSIKTKSTNENNKLKTIPLVTYGYLPWIGNIIPLALGPKSFLDYSREKVDFVISIMINEFIVWRLFSSQNFWI